MSNTDFDPLSVEEPKVSSQFPGPKSEAPKAPPSTDEIRRSALTKALGTEMGGPLADLYQREQAAGERVMLGKAKGEMELAQRIAGAEGAYARGVRGRYAAAEPQLMAPPPKFTVTKDSAEGMNALAVILPIAGLIIGSKGLMAGTNAMNAMAGALEGYQKGNKERIEFETKKYEKAMEEWKNTINQVKDSLARYEKLAATDLAAATAQAKAEAAAKGYGVVKDLIEQQGLSKTREIVEKIATQTAAANARASSSMKLVQVQTPEGPKLVTQEEALTAARSGQPMTPAAKARDAILKPSAAERKNYVGLNQMANTADDLIKKLEDPEFAKKVQKYRLSAFLSEEGGKIASQVLSQKIPPDVQDFINKATNLRNKYYLEISGKAVTGGEAMRNYNVVPQPGDTPDRLRTKLNALRESARGDIGDYQKMYPNIADLTRGGSVVRTIPDQLEQPSGGSKTYEVGDVITINGKRYRATTRGADPDVEEIQ